MTIYIEMTIHCVALSNDDENSDFQRGKCVCAMTKILIAMIILCHSTNRTFLVFNSNYNKET
jgi:hypothetical protein